MIAARPILPAPSEDGSNGQVSKKRKKSMERVRVTRARKIKCNGMQPCKFCTRTRVSCTFESAYARGRLPVIPSADEAADETITVSAEDTMPGSQQNSPGDLNQQYMPNSSSDSSSQNVGLQDYGISSHLLAPGAASSRAVTSVQQSPEPSQEDLQGHYIGPASGVSFLLRVQKRMHEAISFSGPGSIFTFGDAPLRNPDYDPNFCMMLPKEDAQRLVDRYFDFAMPTYRFLHRPTIQEWFAEFYETLGTMRDPNNSAAKVALLFMILAHARVYMPENDKPGPADLRPRNFHDDDIDTELPACVDDNDITKDHINVASSSKGYSLMLAPLGHMKLARIIGHILRALYSVKPISISRRADETQQISKDLAEWRSDISQFLDADYFSTSFLAPIVQRQRNVLNMTYWHAIILTNRQAVLNSFARISRQNRRGSEIDAATQESVQKCLEAAMDTVALIENMVGTGQMFRAFWVTAYFAFTAAMVLYIYVIQKWASPPQTYMEYFTAATRCQSHMSTMVEKGSLSERYCFLLEELRVEAVRQINRMHPSANAFGDLEGYSQENGFQSNIIPMDTPSDKTSYTDLMGENGMDYNGMSGVDFSGWGQFASMISSGLGNLDAFLDDEVFRL
ncbi:hypothetical protein ACHAQI_007315 [Fusarium lateritium]